MKNTVSDFIVTDRGRVYEARPRNHTRLRVFGTSPTDAIRNLRFALRHRWDKRGDDMERIFNETAAKENRTSGR